MRRQRGSAVASRTAAHALHSGGGCGLGAARAAWASGRQWARGAGAPMSRPESPRRPLRRRVSGCASVTAVPVRAPVAAAGTGTGVLCTDDPPSLSPSPSLSLWRAAVTTTVAACLPAAGRLRRAGATNLLNSTMLNDVGRKVTAANIELTHRGARPHRQWLEWARQRRHQPTIPRATPRAAASLSAGGCDGGGDGGGGAAAERDGAAAE